MSALSILFAIQLLSQGVEAVKHLDDPYSDYSAIPIETREKTGCGITLVTDTSNTLFDFVREEDLCQVVKSVTRTTGDKTGGLSLYISPFVWENARGYERLAHGWHTEGMTSFNSAGYLGYSFGDGVLQLDPVAFNDPWMHIASLSKTEKVQRWFGMSIVAHEVLHQILADRGIYIAEYQHCMMMFDKKYWVTITEALGRFYRVDEHDIHLLINTEKQSYSHLTELCDLPSIEVPLTLNE